MDIFESIGPLVNDDVYDIVKVNKGVKLKKPIIYFLTRTTCSLAPKMVILKLILLGILLIHHLEVF